MKHKELMAKVEKLDPEDTQGFIDLAIQAEKAGILDPDTAQLMANSVYDQDAYHEGFHAVLTEREASGKV